MKNLILLTILPVALCCTPGNKSETSSDTTQLSADTVSVPAIAVSQSVPATPQREVIKNFPSIYTESKSEDPREDSLLTELMTLLNKYDTTEFLEIRHVYNVTFNEEIGPDETVSVTESETETWFLNDNFDIRAYSTEFSRSVGNEISSSKTVIYLFEEGNLIASYEDIEESEQEKYEMYNRAIASRCPSCGLSIHEVMSNSYTVDDLVESEMKKSATDFYKKYEWLKMWLNPDVTPPTREGNYYLMTSTSEREGVKYDDDYYISTAVYEGYINPTSTDEGD